MLISCLLSPLPLEACWDPGMPGLVALKIQINQGRSYVPELPLLALFAVCYRFWLGHMVRKPQKDLHTWVQVRTLGSTVGSRQLGQLCELSRVTGRHFLGDHLPQSGRPVLSETRFLVQRVLHHPVACFPGPVPAA